MSKCFPFLIVALFLFLNIHDLFADAYVGEFNTVESTKNAKINVYVYESKRDEIKQKPILFVHGFNSNGKAWHEGKKNYVQELTQNGYDVIVVDMRGNAVDTNGDNNPDAPVVGSSWAYGVNDLGDDVGTALAYGIDYLNKNLPGRDYQKADVVTHSTGALAVTSYSRSQGLVPYRNNIDTVIELAPPNNGSTSLVANIRESAQMIPSVFAQSMVAYQYALDFIADKVWIPGGRMESESLRRQLMPESLFLKSIEGLGPAPGITTLIAIGDEDWVVGDWSPVIKEREDIGYEYFMGLDHFNFCGSELIITALLDRLEKGAESDFFNRYKPYRNKSLLAFLSGPGIDHPDDTFDVVTFASGIVITPRELFDLYLRIAGRKDKTHLLRYWEALSCFEDAQEEIDNGSGESVIIDKWKNLLAEKNESLQDDYADASKEYEECPDIAVLANGYYIELVKLIIEKAGEPVRIVDHTFNPAIVNEQKLLLIPSGGLSGLSYSPIFRKKISEFVKNGGTIACFSQQYGYDFAALPAGGLNGYGWQEDVSCHSSAAYIESFHQILSSQTALCPDFKLDGYFTEYPEDAEILLRRSKNLMPAMLIYNFGQGRVIAASLYSDWGYSNGQTSTSEINLIRDLIRWSKSAGPLPEYESGKIFEESFQVSKDFSEIEMILSSPDGTILEKKLSNSPRFESETILTKPGIYSVDYILYGPDSEIIQPRTEGFYFCVSDPPEGSVADPDFTFDITSDSESYIKDTEVVFTFHLQNNTAKDENIKCKAEFTHHDSKLTQSIVVPAGSRVSFDKNISMDKTDRVMANFYSSGNYFLGRAERGVGVYEPKVEVILSTDKTQYIPGQTVAIECAAENNSETAIDLLFALNIVDSGNSGAYYDSKVLRLDKDENISWDREFEIPRDAVRGIYRIKLNAFSNSNLVGSKSVDIDIPAPLIYDDELPADFFEALKIELSKFVYLPGETIFAEAIITNKGEKLESAVLDISVLPGAEIGSLFGTVKDKEDFPVEGALVNTVYTNIDGKYKLENIDRGKYSFSVRANGYNSLSGEIDILGGENTFDAALESTEYGNLSGVFADSIGSYLTLNPVDVAGSDACVRYAVISSEGMFEFKHLPSGLYELYTQPEDITEPIQIKEGDNVCSRLSLEQEEDLGLTPEDVEWLEVHEAEPNNDFTGANEITGNVVIIGKIYDYGDEDYFTITIDEPSILNVSVKNVTQGFRPNLKIYNPDKRPVVSTAALSGQEIEYSFEAGEPGIYYILLRDRYNTFSSQEEYSLKIELTLGSDRYEPNPDFTSAKEIDIRKTIISTIFPAGDEDYFVIDAEEKGLLYIDMLNVPEGLRPSLKIYDSSKKLISQKGGTSGEKIDLDAELKQPGKHYLTVKDWYSSFSSPDAYSFKAYFIKTTDEYEPNNIKAEAGPVEFGKDYFATISVKGDNDFYKISVPDSGKVTVYIKDVPANLRPYMRLYKDPRDSYIDSAAGSAGEDLSIEFETGDPSNYFIQVQDRYNSESSFLRYRLTALYVPDDDYLSKDLAIFKQTVAVPTVTHVKNIDIEIPSIEKTGKYYLQAALRSQDSQKNYQCVERFYVSDLDDSEGPEPSPEIEVALLEDGESVFTAGDAVSFKFRVENKGAAAGKCGIGFKFMDLFEKDLSEFLEPGDKKELEVGFQLPPDTEEGLYEAVYAFNGEEHIISFKIEGVTLDVEAEFKEGVLKLRIQNTGSAENVSLFAEARFGETETKKDFTLTDSKEISFSIPGAQDRSKIYYGVYFSSGKALYLGSVLADNEEEIPNSPFKVLEARCDKESYARDESVTFKWEVNSSVPADVNLLADIVSPDSDSLEVINESIFLDEGAIFIERTFDPGFAKPGLYRLLYRFIYESSVIARGSVFFDVDGESRIDLYIDKNEYTEGENVKLEARCFSSFSLSGDLNVFLDGDEAKKKKGIDLDGYEVFDFNINVKDTGKHYLYCELLYGNESITSDKETFYVLAMPKPNYSPVLLAIGDKIVTAGEYLEFTVEATDMDGDILLYSVETMPDGAYFGPDTKKFSWQPARNQSGKYFVTFNVSDGIDSVSEKVKITVSEAEPLPPAAKPLAEPLEGKAPLEVNFSADTVSGAGNIVKYEWDFDGKGVYDFSSLESGDTMFMYSGEGDFSAVLRVTDREGYANIYTAGINVESIPESPCVYLEASPLKGVSPSKVYFKGSVLSQADICKYEWDFNGDGVYDACSADSSCVVKTYTVPGDYYAELKVTNAKGLSGSQKILIQISDPKVLSIEPIFLNDRGSVPIEVGFDALVDSGAAIQKYQWDFDSDGVFDFTSTDSAKTKYTYFEPGVYAPTLRVTDQNNMASEAEKELRFGMLAAQDIRKGKISADIKKGKAPLSVKFSFDCESHAGDAKYFWDFEGDGICNMITLLPEAEHIYHDSGVYMAKVDAQLDNIFIRNCREVIYVTSGKNNNNGIVGLDTLSPSARKNIQVDKLNKVKFSDRTALVLPAGILDMDDEVDIRKLEGDEVVRAIDLTDDILCVGEYREYKFNSHDGVFDKEMTITIPYLDVDGDGFTDDNNVDELTMDAYWFDETKEEWKLLSDALVFPEENIVTVKTNHFSVFGIAGTPKENESGSGTGSDESEVDMSNCFIATAVFGTPMAEEVKILCDFRDRFLLKSTAGRNFVDFYYRHSPPVANFIKDKPLLKSPIRFTLKYLVKLIQLAL